jgi:hypothetical protein
VRLAATQGPVAEARSSGDPDATRAPARHRSSGTGHRAPTEDRIGSSGTIPSDGPYPPSDSPMGNSESGADSRLGGMPLRRAPKANSAGITRVREGLAWLRLPAASMGSLPFLLRRTDCGRPRVDAGPGVQRAAPQRDADERAEAGVPLVPTGTTRAEAARAREGRPAAGLGTRPGGYCGLRSRSHACRASLRDLPYGT